MKTKKTVGKQKQKQDGEEYLYPRLVLQGKLLQKAGFEVGDNVDVIYKEGGNKMVIKNVT